MILKQSRSINICRIVCATLIMSLASIASAENIDQGEIKFVRGSSSAILSGNVVRGDRDHYSLNAGAGQWMEVEISSLEDNAVFSLSIAQYGSENQPLEQAGDLDDANYWYGQLPDPAYSKNGKQNAINIMIGGTRGNAAYELNVTIKNQDWQAHKAGFDCNKASTQAEKLICSRVALRDADATMSAAYKKLYKALSQSEQKILKADQRSWLKARTTEFANCEAPYCHVFYSVRIAQLDPVSKAGFNCQKAATRVEKKICNSRLLQHADGRMAATYNGLLNFDGGGQIDPQEQRDWLKLRNQKLGKSSCDTACAWQFYNEHTEELMRRWIHGSL